MKITRIFKTLQTVAVVSAYLLSCHPGLREGGLGGTSYPGLRGSGLKELGRVQVSALSFGMAPKHHNQTCLQQKY